ncbi:hypothetical protein ACRRTK_015319 [Alexandromys fortis]
MTAKNLEYQEGRVQEKTIEEGNLPENAPPVNSSIPPEYITLLTSEDPKESAPEDPKESVPEDPKEFSFKTLDNMVDNLVTSLQNGDHNCLHVFLCTYPTYTTTQQVLDMLFSGPHGNTAMEQMKIAFTVNESVWVRLRPFSLSNDEHKVAVNGVREIKRKLH